MGKKEKFIDKANSQKFHVLHRSQRDEAHANYEVPSNFVLVPAVDNGNNNSNNNGGGGRYTTSKPVKLTATKDHINELGFANDGYDYSQHLRDLGSGGHFISKTGRAGTDLDLAVLTRAQGTMIELPEDCMPSEKNLDRHYEAITINHKLMDKDIRAALFDGFDEEGEFEELQDDFITQVMSEPADDDFDFDAHIAKLIARSEQTLGLGPAPGKKPKVKFAGQDSDSDEDEDGDFDSDDEFPDYLMDEMDPEAMAQYRAAQQNNKSSRSKGRKHRGDDEEEEYSDDGADGAHFVAGGAKDAAVGPLSAEAREALELQFERTLQEYEDDEIGYMEYLDEEDFGGEIDLEDEGAFNAVLDEYLLEKKDNLFIEGTGLRKGVRASVKDPTKKTAEEEEEEAAAATPADLHALAAEQNALQADTEAELLRMKHAPKDTGIETCQAYLQEVRIEEEWDCESILSTYSTLDNHPTVIKDTNSKFRKYRSPHQRQLDAEAAAAGNMSTTGSVMSRSSHMSRNSRAGTKSVISKGASIIYGTPAALSVASSKNSSSSSVPGKIVLGGRLNLPEGFGPSQYEKRKELPQRSLDSSTMQVQSGINVTPNSAAGTAGAGAGTSSAPKKGKSRRSKATAGQVDRLENIAEGESESESEASSNDENSDNDEVNSQDSFAERKRQAKLSKRRAETAEEKKARKEAVKEERRTKRQGKKELKTAFKMEGSKIIRSVGQEQSIDHVSVFRY